MNFLGTFKNLTGETLPGFTVEGLVGRDGVVPRWRVACQKCGAVQFLSHTKLAPLMESKTNQTLQCTNGACAQSRTHRKTISLSDLRREERDQAEQAARAAEDARRKAQAEAAKGAKLEALKNEWRSVWRHQIKTKIAEERIVSFQRWCQLSDGTRQMVLETLRKDPGAYFTGL